MIPNNDSSLKTPMPQRDARDAAPTIAKEFISLVSIAGRSAEEPFSYLVIPSLEKRWDKWRPKRPEDLQALEAPVEDLKVEAVFHWEESVVFHELRRGENIQPSHLQSLIPN